MRWNHFTVTGLCTVAALFLAGCGQAPPPAPTNASQTSAKSHSHDGWWCDEHGVPEDVCALCDTKVAARLKANGDWCQNHDCPDSQCFTCHPERQAEFAAQYEARYGKQPPQPSETMQPAPHTNDKKS